jgi:hypothetical protein
VWSRPPSVKPASASRSVRPLPINHWATLVTVASGSRPEGPDGSGVNGLTLGPLRLLDRLSPAGQDLPQGHAPPSPSARLLTAEPRVDDQTKQEL